MVRRCLSYGVRGGVCSTDSVDVGVEASYTSCRSEWVKGSQKSLPGNPSVLFQAVGTQFVSTEIFVLQNPPNEGLGEISVL